MPWVGGSIGLGVLPRLGPPAQTHGPHRRWSPLCSAPHCAALYCTVLYCLQVEAYLAEQDVGGEGAHEEEEEVVEPA